MGLALLTPAADAKAHGGDEGKATSVTETERRKGGMDGPQDAYIRASKFDQKLNSQVPLDATFRDENGKTVQLKQYFNGKPVVFVTVFYRCTMLCSVMLNEAVRSFQEQRFSIGKDYNVVTLSIDPRETPTLAKEKQQEYLKQYGRIGAEAGWPFLTGTEKEIKRVTDSIGFRYKYDPKSDQYAHPNGIVIATPHGKVSRYLYGITYPSRDLKFGLMQASTEKIGSPVEQLLLTCFHYNPETGKYDVLIMGVVRLAGALTVFLILSSVGLMAWRERKLKLRPRHDVVGAEI